jgi:hypothetical protein
MVDGRRSPCLARLKVRGRTTAGGDGTVGHEAFECGSHFDVSQNDHD